MAFFAGDIELRLQLVCFLQTLAHMRSMDLTRQRNRNILSSPSLALKSVKQAYHPSEDVSALMQTFRLMANYSIRKGLETNASSLKRLSLLCYVQLKNYDVPSYYCLTAISKGAGILASRKKSMRRGIPTKDPYLKKPILVSCYSFKINKEDSHYLVFRLSKQGEPIKIGLTKHTVETIQGLEVRSFTLTENSLSLTVRKECQSYDPISFMGIDRNASNITYGNSNRIVKIDLEKIERIARTTKEIVRSFNRNDVKIRRRISSKYGRRRAERVKQILQK